MTRWSGTRGGGGVERDASPRLRASPGCSRSSILRADHEGSIVALTNPGGGLTINSYDEYGIPGSANSGRFQYTGQAWLSEVGMYYKARIYSPTLGRFLQTDPIGYKDQINLYEYVGDDPIDKDDFTGTETGQVTSDTMAAIIADERDHLDPQTAKAGLIGVAAVYTAGLGAAIVGDYAVSATAARVSAQGAADVERTAASVTLKQNVARNVGKIANIGQKNAKTKDFLGVLKERAGTVTGHDHITEMEGSRNGLRNAADSLSRTVQKYGESMSSAERSAINKATKYANKLADRMESFLSW